jgi:hypothetical protein
MDTTAQIVWRSFLESCPLDKQNILFHYLSPGLLNEIKQLSPVSIDPRKGIEPLEEELSQIHFSWFAPILRSFPESEIKLFTSCLTPEQIKGLKQSLLLSTTPPLPSNLGTSYLKKTLFELIASPDLIPIACLPNDPLNALLDLTPHELFSLIDLLSMHDLSVEIRHIIETTKLKEIYALLSKAQTTFLKTLLHRKEPVSFKKMGLTNWKGDKAALQILLSQRGINRVAKALFGHHPSLLWHIAHRLDIEKGQLLIKLCTALDHPRASALLGEQVIEMIHAIKNNNPPSSL